MDMFEIAHYARLLLLSYINLINSTTGRPLISEFPGLPWSARPIQRAPRT